MTLSSPHRVLLYNPRAVFYTMPLGVLAVGSAIDRRRYTVEIVDGRLEPDPVQAVLGRAQGALCLGISVLTGAPILDALAVARAVKARYPDLPIVWGGWHPSLFPEQCLSERSVDIAVAAQGESTFAEVVERLAAGESLDGCLGCTYRDANGEVITNPPRPLLPLDSFPPHDYSLLQVPRYFDLKRWRQIDYISSQGCLFRCAFCADPFVFGRKWVGLPPERMGEELAELWRRYQFDDLSFQDETFFTRTDRVSRICDEILRRGLRFTWRGTMRADQGARLDESVLAECKRAGLAKVMVGVETGSPEMLQRIKKDIKIEQIFETAEKCRRLDIGITFPFIVGFPSEPPGTLEATLRIAKQLRAMSPRFVVEIFYFKPYPGSILTQEAEHQGYVLPQTLEAWGTFDFVGSAGPWVTPETFQRVERFKFYQRFAWAEPQALRLPLQMLSRWRCEHDRYEWPIEKAIIERVHRGPALS